LSHAWSCQRIHQVFAGLRFLWALNGRVIIGQKNASRFLLSPNTSMWKVDKSSRMAYRLLFPGFFEEFEVIVPIETLVSKESEFAWLLNMYHRQAACLFTWFLSG
jgi:hypothetical protein